MAYQSKNLSALGYANGFTLWHYKTADGRKEVGEPGYFNPDNRRIRVGDFVLVNSGHGEKAVEPPYNFIFVMTGLGRDEGGNAIVEVAPLDKLPG